jgi:putative 4-mercaptohistidine N1-methyltranferase
VNPYETDKLLGEYLLFHFGTPAEILPWESGPRDALDFAVRSVSETLDTGLLPAEARALDVGCAVGRAAFELARHCREVIGIDYSRAFVNAAAALAEKGELPYRHLHHGEQTLAATARVPEGIDRARVRFEAGDACNLRGDLGAFDVVLAANLICRLPRPRAFFKRLPELVKPGGQFILTSPYTYLEEYTPRARWLGGHADGVEPAKAVAEHLRGLGFSLHAERDLPFLIRETARKYQWSVAHATTWTREQG